MKQNQDKKEKKAAKKAHKEAEEQAGLERQRLEIETTLKKAKAVEEDDDMALTKWQLGKQKTIISGTTFRNWQGLISV